MKIVFLGSGAFGLPALRDLAASSHQILHVISQPDRPAGRGKTLTPTPVSQWALEASLPLTRTENANHEDTLNLLRALQPECLVVIAFGQKLSDPLLGTAPRGGINLHSSLLPKYRGAAPINWAVINGDRTAGVSVITITSIMDAGDILATAATDIGESETAGELHDRLAELGAPLLPLVLDQLTTGAAQRISQDRSQATRAPKLNREIAWIDWTRPAAEVSARIRGLSPWPGVQAELLDENGKPRIQATILKCVARGDAPHAPEKCGAILPDHTVACGLGSLQLLTLQPPGKRPMDSAAFANGYRPTTAMRRALSSAPLPTRYDARMNFMIRQASTTDVPSLAHIELAVTLSCYSALPEQKRADFRPRAWREWIQNARPFHHPQSLRRAFIAYDWRNIFGFAAVRHQSNYAGFASDMSGMFVLPRYQHVGLGRALFIAAARWLAVDAIYTMTVDCYATGPGPHFFERMGGRVLDRWGEERAYLTFGFNNLREIVAYADSER